MSKENLLKPEWATIESDDLRILLEVHVGGDGQLSGVPNDHRLFIPLGGPTCRLIISFNGNRISAIERGEAFDPDEWSRISATIDALINTAPNKIGRDIAFSSGRVTGSWRGAASGVQILPPPADASTVPVEMGEHPFILEFPIHSDQFRVMNARRRRECRKLAMLLNLLLRGRVNCETKQTDPNTRGAEWGWGTTTMPGSSFHFLRILVRL
jgi:hypothetical protein